MVGLMDRDRNVIGWSALARSAARIGELAAEPIGHPVQAGATNWGDVGLMELIIMINADGPIHEDQDGRGGIS
jgi:hypothetical protein